MKSKTQRVPTAPLPRRYRLEPLAETQLAEIRDLVNGLFPVEHPLGLYRRQWQVAGLLALGKAQRLDDGAYDLPGANVAGDNAQWADELRAIAEVIFTFFQGGDGKI